MAQNQPRLMLFSSSTSQKGLQAEELIRRFLPQTKIIRLDTKEQRDRAAREGKYFSITGVPTLVAHHPNDRIDIWETLQKIAELIQSSQGGDRGDRGDRGGDRGGRGDRGDRGDRSRGRNNGHGNNMYDNPTGMPRSRYEREDYSSEEEEFSEEEPPPRRRSAIDHPPHPPKRSSHKPMPTFEESSDEGPEEPPPKPKKKVKFTEPPKRKKEVEGKELARRKLSAARKTTTGKERVPSSTKRGREEANKKLSVLKGGRRAPNKMKNIMSEAKAQEAALKAHLAD